MKDVGCGLDALTSFMGFMMGGTDRVEPRVECNDGVSLSVQASRNHYCSPRSDNGPWTTVEVGYPSVDPGEAWREFQEDEDNPTETVYGNVPIELVEAFIEAHGGLKA
jgi:hypothetical protein